MVALVDPIDHATTVAASEMIEQARRAAELAAEQDSLDREQARRLKQLEKQQQEARAAAIKAQQEGEGDPAVIPEPASGEETAGEAVSNGDATRSTVQRQRKYRVREKDESFTDTLARLCLMCNIAPTCGAGTIETAESFPMDLSVMTEESHYNYVRVQSGQKETEEEQQQNAVVVPAEDEAAVDMPKEPETTTEEEQKVHTEEPVVIQGPPQVPAPVTEATTPEAPMELPTEYEPTLEDHDSVESFVEPKEDSQEQVQEEIKDLHAEEKSAPGVSVDERDAPEERGVESPAEAEEEEQEEEDEEEKEEEEKEESAPVLDVFMTKEQREARHVAEKIELDRLRNKRRHVRNLQKPRGKDDIEKARLQHVLSDLSDSAETTYTTAFNLTARDKGHDQAELTPVPAPAARKKGKFAVSAKYMDTA
jgi:hypothetical protein